MKCRVAASFGRRDEETRLRMESDLTDGARPVRGRVVRKTLLDKLVGSRTDTSTSPLGRSSNRH